MSAKEQGGPVTETTELTSGSKVAAHPSLSGPARSVEANRAPAQSAAGVPQSIDLHIEELILHGFADGDRRHIGDSFETEMTRLFTDSDVSPSMVHGGEIALLDELKFDLEAGASPESIGIQLARVIFKSFSHA